MNSPPPLRDILARTHSEARATGRLTDETLAAFVAHGFPVQYAQRYASGFAATVAQPEALRLIEWQKFAAVDTYGYLAGCLAALSQ